MICPPEYADLETIAEGWGVPVSSAMWAIVASELARWRRPAPEYGKHGIAIAAATTVLRLKGLEAESDITAGGELEEAQTRICRDFKRLWCKFSRLTESAGSILPPPLELI